MPHRAGDWGHLLGSTRSRHLVWIGVVVVLIGVVVAAVAIVRWQQLTWLWAPAGVLVLAGVVLLAVGRPSSTSRVPDRTA